MLERMLDHRSDENVLPDSPELSERAGAPMPSVDNQAELSKPFLSYRPVALSLVPLLWREYARALRE